MKKSSGCRANESYNDQSDVRLHSEYSSGSCADFRPGALPGNGNRRRGSGDRPGSGQFSPFLSGDIFCQSDQGTYRTKISVPDKKTIFRLYSVGIPATLNLALPSILISALNGILSSFSQVYILVLGIYYKLQTFLYLPANGFIQGMRPLVGFNYGAGEYRRVKQIYNIVLLMSGAIMAVGTVICLAVPGPLMGLFTENPKPSGQEKQRFDYQRRLYRFCSFRNFVRSSGRNGKRDPFPDYLSVPLYCRYYSGGICSEPDFRGSRSVECFLGGRTDYCGCCFCSIPESIRERRRLTGSCFFLTSPYKPLKIMKDASGSKEIFL